MHSVLFSDDWSPNTTWHSNLVGPYVRLAGGGDCDFYMIKSLIMKVDGNIFADSSAHDGGAVSAYELPVSQMAVTRNIFFNTTRMNPKQGLPPTNVSSGTQHFFPGNFVPYNVTLDEFYRLVQPKCPESWEHPPAYSHSVDQTDQCGFSFPLGRGGLELPESLRSALTVTEVNFNYYAGFDESTWTLLDDGYTGSAANGKGTPAKPYNPW
eukprot:SAG31_NODE_6353_length_2048_cov_1.257055_3_plen_210_part_00